MSTLAAMTIVLFFILYLLLAHWVGDFLFQSTWMATNKYNSWEALLLHTATYTVIMTTFIAPIFFVWDLVTFLSNVAIFAWSCFFFHTLQDYFTSKMTHKQFERKVYNGPTGAFTIIGFDQFLHFVQLFGTFYLLIMYNGNATT